MIRPSGVKKHSGIAKQLDVEKIRQNANDAKTPEEAERWLKIAMQERQARFRNRLVLLWFFVSILFFVSGAIGLYSLARNNIYPFPITRSASNSKAIFYIDDQVMRIGLAGLGSTLVYLVPDLLPVLKDGATVKLMLGGQKDGSEK